MRLLGLAAVSAAVLRVPHAVRRGHHTVRGALQSRVEGWLVRLVLVRVAPGLGGGDRLGDAGGQPAVPEEGLHVLARPHDVANRPAGGAGH